MVKLDMPPALRLHIKKKITNFCDAIDPEQLKQIWNAFDRLEKCSNSNISQKTFMVNDSFGVGVQIVIDTT